MPRYKVTDPTTGKSLSLTGDSPPTEQELNDIFSQVHGDQTSMTPEFQQDKSYPAEATMPPEQKLLENTMAATSGFTLPGAVASLASGAKALLSRSESPLAQAIVNTPQEIGAKMKAGEQAVGITDRLPELRGAKPSFPKPEMNVPTKVPTPVVPAETVPSVPPQSYPRDPSTFVNSARARIDKFKSALSPQELSDYKRQLTTWLSDGTLNPRTPIGAIASQLKTDVTALHNAAIPGRAALNPVYGLSKTLHPDIVGALKDYATKYGKRTLAEAVAIATGIGIGRKVFK